RRGRHAPVYPAPESDLAPPIATLQARPERPVPLRRHHRAEHTRPRRALPPLVCPACGSTRRHNTALWPVRGAALHDLPRLHSTRFRLRPIAPLLESLTRAGTAPWPAPPAVPECQCSPIHCAPGPSASVPAAILHARGGPGRATPRGHRAVPVLLH